MVTSVVEGTASARAEQSEAATTAMAPAVVAPPDPSQGGWRYAAAGKRDLRLDLLRGFAVFAMVVDHIGGASWLHFLSGGNRFFVSAAEVFVFISGLMVGLIYTERARRDGFRPSATKLLKRAWTLYALAVWLALATAFAAALFDLPRGVILGQDPARFIFEVLTLQRTFYLVDVMLFYAFAMLVAPMALGVVLRGGWWFVAFCSVALWGMYQRWPAALQLPWAIADNPVFNFAAWQILFFGGMLLGSWRGTRERSTVVVHRPVSRFLRELALPAFAAALGALIFVHLTNGRIFAPYIAESDTGVWLDRWFDKSALPFPRLLACLIVFGFLWSLVSRCWRPLHRGLGWFLVPLGQGALYAYAAHLFVIIALQIAILQI
ncbi:MAG TPA: OpgC domain-containing protein, partial [Thermomicrobiales bacterium]